ERNFPRQLHLYNFRRPRRHSDRHRQRLDHQYRLRRTTLPMTTQTTTLSNALVRLQQFSPRTKLAGLGAIAIVVAAGACFVFASGRGCSTRDNVTARVALVSSRLQAAAAQGKIKIEDLATGIRRLNGAATTYNANADHAAYCAELDKLSDDYKLGD